MFKYTIEAYKGFKETIRPNPNSSEINMGVVLFAVPIIFVTIIADTFIMIFNIFKKIFSIFKRGKK